MFDIQNYVSFIAAILVFQLIPGPGTLAILNATGRDGVRAGLGAVLGTLLGDFLYMVAAVAGLATIMQANPLLFQGLQWLGVVYLCWMGIQLLRSSNMTRSSQPERQQSSGIYFQQAFVVSLTNPKVILFFVAFFPLFLRPDASTTTLAMMMLHVTVLSFLYQAGLVVVGHQVAQRLKTLPSARKIAIRLAGVTLIGFGVKLALNNR